MELLELIEDWKGYKSLNEVKRPENYETRLKETIDLITNIKGFPTHKAEYLLKEAMTTSDFPLLLGDVLDRQMLTAYKSVEPAWKPFVKLSTVSKIFPEVGGYRYAVTGGDQILDEVPEKGEYKFAGLTEARYALYVKKYGRKIDISWEAILNDTLGGLSDIPVRFAKAAIRTEHRIVSSTYGSDLGTHAGGNLYQSGINYGTSALTIENLEIAIQAMQSIAVEGEPILNKPKYLVVHPRMEMTARSILTAANKMWVDVQGGAGATVVPFPTANVLPQMGLSLIVDPYLSVIEPSYTKSWYLFSDPNDIAALEFAHLRGYERPEICIKASNKVTIGGGDAGAMSGDFESDNIVYRVRHVFGGVKLDWRATYYNRVS